MASLFAVMKLYPAFLRAGLALQRDPHLRLSTDKCATTSELLIEPPLWVRLPLFGKSPHQSLLGPAASVHEWTLPQSDPSTSPEQAGVTWSLVEKRNMQDTKLAEQPN